MNTHFNIGKKVVVNVFENIKHVLISEQASSPNISILRDFLDKASASVETRKIKENWKILYNVEHLDFTTIISWYGITRGKFYIEQTNQHGRINSFSIHFSLEDDCMICW